MPIICVPNYIADMTPDLDEVFEQDAVTKVYTKKELELVRSIAETKTRSTICSMYINGDKHIVVLDLPVGYDNEPYLPTQRECARLAGFTWTSNMHFVLGQ